MIAMSNYFHCFGQLIVGNIFYIPKDFDRNLTEKGQSQALAMSKKVADLNLSAEQIICSTANRTQQTMELILPAFGDLLPAIEHSDNAYLAGDGELLNMIHQLNNSVESAMFIGHNPGLHQLVQALSGTALMSFSPCTLAILEASANDWQYIAPNSMHLVDLIAVE